MARPLKVYASVEDKSGDKREALMSMGIILQRILTKHCLRISTGVQRQILVNIVMNLRFP
jgi:hypothetical protein